MASMATTTILRGVPVKLPATPGIKGSCARVGAGGGKSIVAIGAKTATVVPAGSSIDVEFTIAEAGHADRLFLSGYEPTNVIADPLRAICVDAIVYDNDNLTSGINPATMFRQNADQSPLFGHYFEVNHQLKLTLSNASALPITVCAGWSVA